MTPRLPEDHRGAVAVIVGAAYVILALHFFVA
jgi:hypothetical protein